MMEQNESEISYEELDKIYDDHDRMFRKGEFDVFDTLLDNLNVQEMSIHHIIAYLTTSRWASSQLKARDRFCDRAREELSRRGYDKPQVMEFLKGLVENEKNS